MEHLSHRYSMLLFLIFCYMLALVRRWRGGIRKRYDKGSDLCLFQLGLSYASLKECCVCGGRGERLPELTDVYHVFAVLLKARRGCWIPLELELQTVVSCSVGAGN